jgi:hypothetical protein
MSNSSNPATVSRRLVVASRLVLLVVATGAAVAAVTVAVHEQREAAGVVYVCPMHPEVSGFGPGTCPICRMALEAKMPGSRPVDETAIDNLRKHGVIERVRKRSLLFDSREMRAPASVGDDGIVTALYYDDQIPALGPAAMFAPGDAPEVALPVRRTADAPVRWDRSTSQVRFRLQAARSPRLEAGRAGWVEAPRRTRDVLTVPSAAVLQSPGGAYVLVPAHEHGFEKRPIEIGETFVKDGFAVVLSGLRVHDLVVSRASFFLDADRRLGMATKEGEP